MPEATAHGTPDAMARAGARASTWTLWAAFVRRDALEAASYRAGLLLDVLGSAGVLLSLAFMARFVDRAPNPALRDLGGGYLPFALLGLVGSQLAFSLGGSLPRRLRQAQLAGTLEAVLATPAPAPLVVAALPLGDLLGAILRAVLLLAAGVLLLGARFVPLQPGGWLALAALTALALPALLGVGLVGGALTLLLRRSDPLSFAFSSATVLLAGAMYPVSVLPRGLRLAGLLLPARHLLDGLHAIVLSGGGLGAVGPALGALALAAVLYGGGGVLLLAWALRRARRDGSLGCY